MPNPQVTACVEAARVMLAAMDRDKTLSAEDYIEALDIITEELVDARNARSEDFDA